MRDIESQLLHGNVGILVLSLLADQKCHGYQIRRELALRSRGYFQIAFGRLYPLLGNLARTRLVSAHWVKAGKVRQRKQYSITNKGRAELHRRRAKWRQFCAAMDLVLTTGKSSSARTRR